MDVLAANDQENLVHNLQAGAAAKSLNAGLKGISAKTPGYKVPKTPFKVPLNDENAVTRGGKSVLKTNGKGNENLLKTIKKDGRLDNAFVTPAGPRTRAPLGMKTTNAKTKAFQTPAPLSTSAKTQKLSPRLRRPKVKVHQPEVQDEEEDDVPEVEYMPPKEVPLEDDLADYLEIPRDWKFPMFEGKNMTRGIWEAYHNPVEDDGRTRLQREFEEGLERDIKKRGEEFDRIMKEHEEKELADLRREFGVESPKKAVQKPAVKPDAAKRTATGPSTLKARSAVAAFSDASKPGYAAPTAAINSRLPSGIVSGRKPAKPVMNPSTSRHAAATAASKSTIGYAQGRATSNARKPLSNVTRPALVSRTVTAHRRTTSASAHTRHGSTNAAATAKSRGAFSRSSSTATDATLVAPAAEEQSYRSAEDLERDLELLRLAESDDEDVDAWMNSFASQLGGGDPFDEDLKDFELQLPEGI